MRYLITIFGAIAGFCFAMIMAFKQGKKDEKAENIKEMLKQNEEKQKIDNFVNELSNDDLDDLVREFRRKD